MSAHALLKLATKSENLTFWGYFPKAKTQKCNQKRLKCLQQIRNYYALFSFIFSESRCTRFIESSFLEVKTTVKFEIFRLFFSGRNRGVRPRQLKCLWWFWNYYTLLCYISFRSGCTRFTESNHQSLYLR